MTTEATSLLAAALKSATLRGSFDPKHLGSRLGLSEFQSVTAARDLSNLGILVLEFDLIAHFSADYRKSRFTPEPKRRKKKITAA